MNWKTYLPPLLACLLAVSCGSSTAPPQPTLPPVPPAKNLLFDLSDFPDGWAQTPCTSMLCQNGITASEAFFWRTHPPARVNQEIHAYGNISDAINSFASLRGLIFRTSSQEPSTPYKPPAEITYQSPIADEFHLACGVDIILICRSLSRYRNYLIELFMPVINEYENTGMTYSEVEAVLRALDTKVGKLLGLNLPVQP